MDTLARQQSNIKLLLTENLRMLFESTTKQARTGSPWGPESGVLNSQVCRKYCCILLWILFYKSKMDQK